MCACIVLNELHFVYSAIAKRGNRNNQKMNEKRGAHRVQFSLQLKGIAGEICSAFTVHSVRREKRRRF